MWKILKPAVIGLLLFTCLTGVAYPVGVTTVAQMLFPAQANGSLIQQNGKVVGSALIGQAFDQPKYFWGRLSGTGPFSYNAAVSSGTNYGPLNPALKDMVQARIAALHKAEPNNTQPIPVDLVTASGSGLDPHISPAAALYQLPRVARARHLLESQVRRLINENTEGRTWGILGEPRVPVLKLNLALDQLSSQ